MIKVAICGNIASGKSEAQKIIEKMGYPVLDTDIIAHKLLENNQREIIREFSGYDISENGVISREKLGRLVFNNKDLKTKLENILHPQIKKEILLFFESKSENKYAFVGIPLLFEANMNNLFDKIIFIYANDDIRLKRLISRNKYTEDYAKKRMESQLSQEDKAKNSDYVIYNNSDLIDLEQEISKIIV